MHPMVTALSNRARLMAARWRARPHNTDRVNRAVGRLEIVISRRCAKLGESLPTLYISGGWLTTWPGNKVARVTVTGTAPAFNTRLTCYSCVIAGRKYYGRGLGEGMCINMRAGRLVSK